MAQTQKPIITTLSKFLVAEGEETCDTNFGIFRLETQQQAPQFNVIDWILNIDRSGSMQDQCPDRKSKMDHIHTSYYYNSFYICI